MAAGARMRPVARSFYVTLLHYCTIDVPCVGSIIYSTSEYERIWNVLSREYYSSSSRVRASMHTSY